MFLSAFNRTSAPSLHRERERERTSWRDGDTDHLSRDFTWKTIGAIIMAC